MTWKSAEELPEQSGDYLCYLYDARDDYDDQWHDVVYFKKPYKAKGRWMVSDFDTVLYWQEIEEISKK